MNCLITGQYDDGDPLLLYMQCTAVAPRVIMEKAKAELKRFLLDVCEYELDSDDMGQWPAWVTHVIMMPDGTDFEQMVVTPWEDTYASADT